jgi:energy-coupling factor transporter ATP-binding protein EcfA2
MNATSVIPAVPPAPPAVGTALIEARDLTRIWGKGNAAQIGISGVDLTIRRGEVVAVIGPSGSGKSTLGALLAGIDRPSSGSLVVDGTRIDRMKTDQLAAWRGRELVPVAVLGVVGGLVLGAAGNRGIIASFEASNAIDIGVVDAGGAIPWIVVGTFVALVGLSALIVRAATHRPITVTLRGAA